MRVQKFNIKLRAFISQLRLYFMTVFYEFNSIQSAKCRFFFFPKFKIKSEKVIILYNDHE